MAQTLADDYDVVVVDSTPGGIAASVAAARRGCSVLLLTEDRHVGGMQTSGLGNTNAGHRETIGGLAREFHVRIRRFYVEQYGPESEQARSCDDGFFFEPSVALKVYTAWLNEAKVTVRARDFPAGVEIRDGRIIAVTTRQGLRIGASVFVDASYEGDLLKMAGCAWHLGRESCGTYGESLAGVRYPLARLGEADDKLQAYDYRLCLTDVAENRVPFEAPANYDSSSYAYQAACLRHAPPKRLNDVLPLNMMPNRKTDSRTGEWIGGSRSWPEATPEERRRIAWQHRDYSAGYLWFLLTDRSVPVEVREELGQWGLARDEFADNDHWPYHIYVREARRLVGEFVMTQRDVTDEGRFKPDSIGLGSFFLDVHPVQMLLLRSFNGLGGLTLLPEGGLGNHHVKPYEIAYRSLLPRRDQVRNLLVPVCLSASHVAFSTIRMEPVYMMLGHAAGLAAAQSLSAGVGVHDVEVRALQAQLVEQGQMIDARPFDDRGPFPRRPRGQP